MILGELDASVKRKIEKKREKALRFESILCKNPFVKIVPSSVLKKCKKKDKLVALARPQDASNDQVSIFYFYLMLLKLKDDVFHKILSIICFFFFQERRDEESEPGLFDIWNNQSNFGIFFMWSFSWSCCLVCPVNYCLFSIPAGVENIKGKKVCW